MILNPMRKSCKFLIHFLAFSGIFLFLDSRALSGQLDTLSRSQESNLDQSISVVRIFDGKKLFHLNEDKLVVPASVSKLTIAAAALDLWGIDHVFNTKAYITGELKQGQVTGDIYIKGDGDPFLVNEKLFIFAADIRSRGIKQILGDFYLDVSLFDNETRDASRDEGKLSSDNAYDAPVSAAGVNFNTFEVGLSVIDNSPQAFLYPYELKGFPIENRLIASSKTAAQVDRYSLKDGRAKLVASGTISQSENIIKFYRSVNDPHLAAAEMIKTFLENQGIKILGRIKMGVTPLSARKIASIDGFPMHFIVKGLNNFSNNFIADMLLKRMGAAFGNEGDPDKKGSGSSANGLKVLNNYLIDQVKIKTPFKLVNASGLSTENRLSAEQVNQMLVKMGQSLELFPEFFASLPSVGKAGTLKKRFDKEDSQNVASLVRAKTGTLSEPRTVVSLAGYVKTRNNGLVAFSILQNGKESRSQPSIASLRSLQDKMVMAIAREF